MATVTASGARARFGELLSRVARGKEIVITGRREPVARMIPEGRPGPAEVRQAVSDLRTLRGELARQRGFEPLTEKEIRDAADQGRPRRATSSGTSNRP